ncbi:MAG TPA: hypothetical protein VMX36_02850 [Sedimentisphaerales bacterium]|nr:hypothetical protein [Sedimentisphaerales bacterium]
MLDRLSNLFSRGKKRESDLDMKRIQKASERAWQRRSRGENEDEIMRDYFAESVGQEGRTDRTDMMARIYRMSHEATAMFDKGKSSEEIVQYLMSQGMSRAAAEDVVKELRQ